MENYQKLNYIKDIMAINLSLYDGVPTTLEIAEKQFKNFIDYPKSHGIFTSNGGYLVLVKLIKGKYKGYWSTFIYREKPKIKYIKIWKIK